MNTKSVQNLHLLFVDDDSDESYLFNEALEQAGLDITLSRAKDGNDLIAFLSSNPLPDMVLIDLNMPHKDGIEALTEIRNIPDFQHLPLVIYSTSKNNSFVDQCYQKGANMFIVKPNNFDGMVEVVRKVCSINWPDHGIPSRDEFLFVAAESEL